MQLWLSLQGLMQLHCMQRLTGVCIRLASIVAEQLMKDGAWVQQAAVRFRQWPAHSGNWPWKRKQHQPLEHEQHQQSQAAEEVKQQKQRLLAAQLLQAQSMLQQHRPDKELMRVIKTLGDSNIPLDTKWLEFTQRLASHGHDAIRSVFQCKCILPSPAFCQAHGPIETAATEAQSQVVCLGSSGPSIWRDQIIWTFETLRLWSPD